MQYHRSTAPTIAIPASQCGATVALRQCGQQGPAAYQRDERLQHDHLARHPGGAHISTVRQARSGCPRWKKEATRATSNMPVAAQRAGGERRAGAIPARVANASATTIPWAAPALIVGEKDDREGWLHRASFSIAPLPGLCLPDAGFAVQEIAQPELGCACGTVLRVIWRGR